eukprot:PhM_4_TR17943/c0_g1_i1/m.72253
MGASCCGIVHETDNKNSDSTTAAPPRMAPAHGAVQQQASRQQQQPAAPQQQLQRSSSNMSNGSNNNQQQQPPQPQGAPPSLSAMVSVYTRPREVPKKLRFSVTNGHTLHVDVPSTWASRTGHASDQPGYQRIEMGDLKNGAVKMTLTFEPTDVGVDFKTYVSKRLEVYASTGFPINAKLHPCEISGRDSKILLCPMDEVLMAYFIFVPVAPNLQLVILCSFTTPSEPVARTLRERVETVLASIRLEGTTPV